MKSTIVVWREVRNREICCFRLASSIYCRWMCGLREVRSNCKESLLAVITFLSKEEGASEQASLLIKAKLNKGQASYRSM